jgi:hypothetical protein
MARVEKYDEACMCCEVHVKLRVMSFSLLGLFSCGTSQPEDSMEDRNNCDTNTGDTNGSTWNDVVVQVEVLSCNASKSKLSMKRSRP